MSTEIAELTGRELDAEVARRVFGCDVQMPYPGGSPVCMCKKSDGGYDPVHGEHRLHPCHDREGLGCDNFELAYYSTDIVAAMKVLEALCPKQEHFVLVGPGVTLTWPFILAGLKNVNDGRYYRAQMVSTGSFPTLRGRHGYGTTLAEAICRMALSKPE